MTTLCALGCGTLASCIISGLLESNTFTNILACVKRVESAARLREKFGDNVTVYRGENALAVSQAQVVLLGCKPQMVNEILGQEGMFEALKGKLLISILAGVTLNQLKALVADDVDVVRAMPNTPCKLNQGMTVISCFPDLSSERSDVVASIFSKVGRIMVLGEKHIDACTALCGSGPAFIAVVIEALVDGGVMMGIPRQEAQTLVAQTMYGTANMVLHGTHPAVLRNDVATPGGCTISGLLTMEDGRLRSTLARTIQEATQTASLLGQSKIDK